MRALDCSLLSDGSADAALLPILKWTVEQHAGHTVVDAVWADLRRVRKPPRTLVERIKEAQSLYPCNLLFIHRDAEGQPPEWRYREIREAVATVQKQGALVPHVCVVPVRMQEAWLLLDDAAIRRAADNPNGTVPLNVPRPNRIEGIADPKAVLHDLLQIAGGLHGRRLRKFRAERRAHSVSSHMCDISVLRALAAFRRFEEDVRQTMQSILRIEPGNSL
jgi:hypothetical protein